MTEVKRRKNETFDSFLRRFQRRIQASGQTIQTKKIRFHKKDPSKTKRREGALRRVEMREEYAYKMKTGQIKEDTRRKQPNRR